MRLLAGRCCYKLRFCPPVGCWWRICSSGRAASARNDRAWGKECCSSCLWQCTASWGRLSSLELAEVRRYRTDMFPCRLTPPYLFVLGMVELTMRWLHNNSVFEPNIADHLNCDRFWWRNALYINSLFPRKDMVSNLLASRIPSDPLIARHNVS